MLSFYWPILLGVFSNVCYHVFAKAMPEKTDPIASLVITYAVSTAVTALLYFLLRRDGNLLRAWGNCTWIAPAIGLCLVGLDVASVYLYRVGWPINMGYLVMSLLAAAALVLVGLLVWSEKLTLTKGIGLLACMAGLFLLNK